MKIRTVMPSLDGATKIINKDHIGGAGDTATLIYFWAMSCPLCEQSIKNLIKLGAAYDGRLAIHAIHMPREEGDFSSGSVKEKIRQLQLTYPVHLDNELQISDRFGNNVVPAYYLFDRQQQLRFFKAGYVTPTFLQRKIQRIIE